MSSEPSLLEDLEAYREAAEHAIENEQVPVGYRDQVRLYFDTQEAR